MAEIAGLVLGAVPLLISALEHYRDIIDPVIRFKNWRGDLKNNIRRLAVERATYHDNLRVLLSKAVRSTKMEEMISDPQCELWTDENLTGDLRDEWNSSYEPCVDLVREIGANLETIAASLNIEGSDQIARGGLRAFVSANCPISTTQDGVSRFEFRRQIRFTMKRSQLNKAIASIERDNDKLGKLLDTKTKINSINESNGLYSKVNIKFVAPLPKIRDNAVRVHQSLRTRFCADHECHQAGLLLQQRIRRRRELSKQEILRNVGTPECFCVSMWKFSEMSWIDTEIRVYDEPSASTSQTGSSVSRMFITGPNIQTTLNTSVPVLETLAITDICTAIHGAIYPQVGLEIDQSGILRGLYEVETRQYHLAANFVTMDHFLPVIHRRDHSMPDLYYLALTLVSSVLQLGETPWLIHSWSRQRIAFLRLEDGSQSSVDIKHPYLACQYDSDTVVPQHEAQTAALRLRNRRTILALAIMLLELNFGTPIENIRTESEMGPDGQPHEQTDFLTAQRWFLQKESKGQLTKGFKSAIWHCLQFSTHYAASFDNDSFVQTIQEKVLEPIEQEFLGTWVDF